MEKNKQKHLASQKFICRHFAGFFNLQIELYTINVRSYVHRDCADYVPQKYFPEVLKVRGLAGNVRNH
jgi:hypothetical protein